MTPSPSLVVDGNNVVGAGAAGWWKDRPAAVRRLLERLACYAAATGRPVELVLDVPQADLPEGLHAGISIRYPDRTGRDAADARILRLLDDRGRVGDEVVTSDRDLREGATRRGATVTGAGSFLARLDRLGC